MQSHRICWAYCREVAKEDAISAASGNASAWRVTIFSRGHVLLLAFNSDDTAKSWVKFFKSLMKAKYSAEEREEKASIVSVRPFFLPSFTLLHFFLWEILLDWWLIYDFSGDWTVVDGREGSNCEI